MTQLLPPAWPRAAWLLYVLPLVACPLGAQSPAAPPVSRGDLVPVYRATDQAYAAALPEAGPLRAAINRAFDAATLRFFSGDLAATSRMIADVRAMLVAPGLDSAARHTPLRRYVVRVSPVAWAASGGSARPATAPAPTVATPSAAPTAVAGPTGALPGVGGPPMPPPVAGGAPSATSPTVSPIRGPGAGGGLRAELAAQRRSDSLTIRIQPLGAMPGRTDTLAVRLELVPAPGSAARGRVQRALRLPMADGTPIVVRLAPAELRGLSAGRYVARLVADAPQADTSFGEPFSVVPVPLDQVRAQLEARVAALAPAPATLTWTRDRFADRLALVNPTPTDDETAVRLSDPAVLLPQLRAELAQLEAQRDPYANAEGDRWFRLRGGRDGLPVRIIASRAVAQSATPVPLLIVLHGAGIDENGFPDGYGDGRWVREAVGRGMLVASPSTIALQRDPALLDSLVAQLARSYRVDAARVYLVGHSMGAGAATMLVQRAGHPFAAAVLLAVLDQEVVHRA